MRRTHHRPAAAREAPAADVADVPAEERKAGEDPRKRYFLIGPSPASTAPAEGYRLLVVLPGGDGGADFHPFAKRIAKNGLPPGYLVAQLVAVVVDSRASSSGSSGRRQRTSCPMSAS